MRFREKKEYYSLRKFKGVGLASALVGLSVMSQGVLAEETPAVSPTSGSELTTVTYSTGTSESSRVAVVPKDSVVSSSITEPKFSPVIEKEVEGNVQPSVVEESHSVVKTSSEVTTTEVNPVLGSVSEGYPDTSNTIVSSSVEGSTPVFNGVSMSSETTKPSLEPREVSENSSSTSVTVSTETPQPTRSRRGKREVLVDNRVLEAYLSYGKKKEIPVSGLHSVDKLDYTTEVNPSTSNDGNVYNNYISKLEKIEGGSTEHQRYRLTLKDGDAIPSGGKIVLIGFGFGNPISSNLIIGTETVGSVSVSTNAPDTLANKLKETTKVDDYIRIVETVDVYDVPLKALTFTFNKQFEKYDRNRVIEFALPKSPYTQLDSSLITRTYMSDFPDSTGRMHKLGKKVSAYLLNPYDSSKVMNVGDANIYVSKANLASSTVPSNKLTASATYKGVTSPFYFDSSYAPVASQLYIQNGDPNASEPALKAGDTFTTNLAENSLFTTTDEYKKGDVVSVDVTDTPSRRPIVTGNRFTDSDNYVITAPPTSTQPLKSKVRFELVEKTDRVYTWKLLDDISVVNSTLSIDNTSLTPMALRSDWLERFGIENFKRYMTSNVRSAEGFAPKGSLTATIVYNIKGVETTREDKGLITKNANLTVGESTTGTVKVVHKTDTGTILKEESAVVTDQPWYTVVNIDPQQFEGYQFKSSTEILSTIAGKGERTIELIYTKPKEVVTKDPIKVKYVVDETKDGGYRNEVEGTATVRTTRTDYIYSPETRTATPKDTVTVTEGTPTVVTLGTKPTTEVTKQAFTTRYVADSERAGGEKFTETAGVEGTTTVTTTYTANTETGVVTPTKGQPEVVAPKEEVIKVGTKTKTEVVSTPKGVVYQADPDAAYENRTTSVAGRDGSTTTTTTYTLNTANGEVTPTTKVDTVEKEDTVIKIGNIRTEMETLPKTTRYEANSEIEFEKKELQVEGQDGEVLAKYTYTVSPTDGSLSNPVRSVDEGEVGGMLPDTYWVGNKKQDRRETAITTRYEADPEKVRDEKETISQGVLGVHTTTTIYKVNDTTGALSDPVVSETDVPMEPKVVKVGTKPTVETQTIAVTTKYIEDENLEFGKVVETEKGSEGRVVTTTTYTLNPADGTTTANKPTVETTPMVQRVVKIGVKKKVVETPIDFTTRYERDDEVEAGKKTPSVSGIAGKIITTITYTMNPTTGVVTENPSTTVREKPITAVVKVGTKPKVEVTPVPFTTSYEADPSADKGSTSDKVVGKDGKVTTTTTYSVDSKTGEVSENPSTSVREEPVNRVVSVGSKPTTVVTEQDYSTRYIEDSSKEVGFKETREKGVKGTTSVTITYSVDHASGKVTPKEGSPVVVTPKEEVVAVGNKSKVEVVTTPKTIRYEKDSEKDKGVSTPSVEGSDGSKTTTTTYTVNPKTGEVTPSTPIVETIPAVEEVVKVGAKDKVEVTPIPVEVEEVADPDLFEGDEEVTSNGKVGSTTTTTEYVVNPKTGEITEKDLVVSTIPMEKKIVHKGTKKRKATVTISYVLKDTGATLGSATVLENQQVGSPYNTSVKVFEPKVEVSELPDRTITKTTTYVLEKEPENKRGIVTETGVSVVYTYRAVVREETVMKESKLTVNFVLEGSGEKLHERLVKEGVRVGDPYVTEPLALQDKVEKRIERNKEVVTTTKYEVTETPKNARGLIEVGGTTVTFTYRAVVSSEEYPTIPSEAPKVDEVEYTEPIHLNGSPETLDVPEFTGGVNPYDAPVYEKPELKIEEPVFTPIIGDSFPRKEVPAEDTNKVSDSEKEKEKPLSPREEQPSVETLKQVLTSNSSQKPQNAPDSISTYQVEKNTPNYQTSPKQAPSGSEQVLPNTGGSESDKLASLSGIGLLGLLGLVGLRKSKED